MILDIENVTLSHRVATSWDILAGTFAKELANIYPDLKPDEIPDEQFQVLPNGNGVIFIKVRDKRIEMAVPKSEFKICKS